MQPRIWLAFQAVSTHWKSCQVLHPPIPLRPYPQSCSSFTLLPACTCAQDCPNPCGGHCTWPFWISWSFTGPCLKPVQVLLDGIPSLQHVGHSTQLAEGALDPTLPVTSKDLKQHQSKQWSLRNTTWHWSPFGCWAIGVWLSSQLLIHPSSSI